MKPFPVTLLCSSLKILAVSFRCVSLKGTSNSAHLAFGGLCLLTQSGLPDCQQQKFNPNAFKQNNHHHTKDTRGSVNWWEVREVRQEAKQLQKWEAEIWSQMFRAHSQRQSRYWAFRSFRFCKFQIPEKKPPTGQIWVKWSPVCYDEAPDSPGFLDWF